jgi:hypothetical protein
MSPTRHYLLHTAGCGSVQVRDPGLPSFRNHCVHVSSTVSDTLMSVHGSTSPACPPELQLWTLASGSGSRALASGSTYTTRSHSPFLPPKSVGAAELDQVILTPCPQTKVTASDSFGCCCGFGSDSNIDFGVGCSAGFSFAFTFVAAFRPRPGRPTRSPNSNPNTEEQPRSQSSSSNTADRNN